MGEIIQGIFLQERQRFLREFPVTDGNRPCLCHIDIIAFLPDLLHSLQHPPEVCLIDIVVQKLHQPKADLEFPGAF